MFLADKDLLFAAVENGRDWKDDDERGLSYACMVLERCFPSIEFVPANRL